MDTINTSSINTPTAAATGHHLSTFEDESIQDALTLHDLASLFDPAHHLDETLEFLDPQVAKAFEQNMEELNTPQVPAVNCGFNPGLQQPPMDDMMAWDEKTMADIDKIIGTLPLPQEEEQQHVVCNPPSHNAQPPALPNGANNGKSTNIATKKRRLTAINKTTNNTSNSGGMKKKRKTECNNNNKENGRSAGKSPSSSSSTSAAAAAAAATTPPGVPNRSATWPRANLFPSAHPQPVRRSFSDTGAGTSVAVAGVEPQRRRKRAAAAAATRTASTSTEDEVSQCAAMGYPSFDNVRFEMKSG